MSGGAGRRNRITRHFPDHQRVSALMIEAAGREPNGLKAEARLPDTRVVVAQKSTRSCPHPTPSSPTKARRRVRVRARAGGPYAPRRLLAAFGDLAVSARPSAQRSGRSDVMAEQWREPNRPDFGPPVTRETA